MCSHSSPAGRTCQSCYAMPPQSQFQTQVASSLTVVVQRVARIASPLAPRSVASGTPGERIPVHQHASLIITRPRQTSHNSLCYRFRIMSTNGHQGPQVLIFSPNVCQLYNNNDMFIVPAESSTTAGSAHFQASMFQFCFINVRTEQSQITLKTCF